ncbi:DUF4082 domain-containing protein [Pelotalea chapellei]|uniref:DUF4082 domain-containing protein n=1 Tax=Pelotalea chapellei TaxID=44671 RepID=A0ABS5U832_9BACT|nr:DUF4082 domain-containing protein [Pelotalea chapellei]MBT1071818.1 DUF4082 domain-containing protein [Pelotalea chapellei]
MKCSKLKAVLFAGVLSMTCSAVSYARDITLQWNANTESNLSGYKVYYRADSSATPFNGTGSGQGASPVNVAKQTTATLTGLDPAKTYYFAVTAYNTAGTESSYSNIVSVAEGVAPTVAITAPAAGSTATGTMSVTATATDNVGVSKVEFYVNGSLALTDTTTPYVYSWNTTALANGSYTLMAKAYDAAGNVGQSANVVVSVAKDTTAPTVVLTSPGTSTTVSGSVAIKASASDNIGISKVEFYDNGVLLNATNVSPYSYNWNTALSANGSHTLHVKAYDAAGNVGQCATGATVTVNNTTTPPPPTGGTTYTAVFGNATGATYLNTIEDTFLNINTELNSTGVFLNAYTWPAKTPANAILMKWNLSALPAGAQIQSATLNLYQIGWNGDSSYAMPVSKIINKAAVFSKATGYTYDGTNAWTASSIPYNSIPLAQSDVAAPVDTPNIDGVNGNYKSWNVTSLVKDWVAAPSSNLGMMINSSNAASADSSRTFVSSESANAGQRPKLTVTYTLPTTTTPPPVTTPPVTTYYSMWPNTTVPSTLDAGADSSAELGVKFKSDVSGYITGIRFYKASTNTGTHTGTLWSSTGQKLATATFTNETASGWQQVNFSTPVAISANTTYVASYHANTGHYSFNTSYFAGKTFDAPPLHALADGGVYSYGSSTVFPTSVYQSGNYWVDVVFKQ